MDKLEVYGQCPKCGGSLVVGHKRPMAGIAARGGMKFEFVRLWSAWKSLSLNYAEAQAIITRLEAENQELHIIIVDREKDKRELMGQVIEVSKRLTELAEARITIDKWKEIDEPDLQARLAANRELFLEVLQVVRRAVHVLQFDDYPQPRNQLENLLPWLEAAVKEVN